MALLPTRILEIEFDAGVWTDVTADFVVLSTRRGRNRELGAFETGRLSFTLRNDDRRYDPKNLAGPYYGKLRPNRRARLRASWADVTYPVFVGYIDRIGQVARGPNDAVAVFEASDFFKLLNRAELLSSVYAAEVTDDGPVTWWRFGDPSDTGPGGTVVDSVGRTNLTVLPNWVGAFGASGLVTHDPDTAAEFKNNQQDGLRFVGPAPVDTPPMSVEALFRLTADGVLLSISSTTTIDGSIPRVYFQVLAGAVLFTCDNGPDTAVTVGSSAGKTDGAVHHVVGTWAADGTVQLYVDGVLVSTAGGADPVVFSAASGQTVSTIGASYNWPNPGQLAPIGIIDEVAVYDYVLSAARVAAHNAAARTAWRGDLPGTRLERIFDLAGVPAADRDIDTGTTTLQSTDLGGSALAYAQKVEETEVGWLFVARDGKLTFVGRDAGLTGPYLTSKATLVDADSGPGIPYRAADAAVDEQTIVTRATVSRQGSVAVTVYDAAAVDEFGWLDEVHDGLLHDDDDYSRSYAEWIVNTHKEPSLRVGAVALDLTRDPAAMYPAILDLELGDRITYRRRPQNVGEVATKEMRVEAISHETGGGYWRTALQLSPFDLAGGLPVFVWDVTKWDEAVWAL